MQTLWECVLCFINIDASKILCFWIHAYYFHSPFTPALEKRIKRKNKIIPGPEVRRKGFVGTLGWRTTSGTYYFSVFNSVFFFFHNLNIKQQITLLSNIGIRFHEVKGKKKCKLYKFDNFQKSKFVMRNCLRSTRACVFPLLLMFVHLLPISPSFSPFHTPSYIF